MEHFTVEAQARKELGKNANRRLRAAGKIPAVIYGKDMESISLAMDPKDILRILRSESGHNTIFRLAVDNTTRDVLIRDFQVDPVKGDLLHADLVTVAMDQVTTFSVPIEIAGTAMGVKTGGLLDVVLREIELQCLPGDVPDNIAVDVSDLQIGDSFRVGDAQLDTSKYTLVSDPDLVILTIVPPKVAVEEEAPEVEEAEEPELIAKTQAEETQESQEE